MMEAKDKIQLESGLEGEERIKEETELGLRCQICGSKNIILDYSSGTLVCQECGNIVREDIVDRGPEWRAFDQEERENRSRGGAPMTYTLHDKGLTTRIDRQDKDRLGREISPFHKSQMYRLRKWHQRVRISDASERNLVSALSDIDRMSSQLSIPRPVRETASMLYREALHKDLIRGRSIEGVTSAALYAACRQCNIPRTLDEIAEVSSVSKRDIGRTYRFISRELDLHLQPIDPVQFVERFGSELNLSGKTRTVAIDLIKKAKEKNLTSGREPSGIAAAAIYLVSIMTGEKRTQRDVAEAAHVTEVTIRNRRKEMVEVLGLEVDI